MATVTTHAPGTFCWFELATRDPNGAKKYYGPLFGYEVVDQDVGGGAMYTVLRLAGREAAAISRLNDARYPAGTPSHWMTYLAVEDADATARKVAAGGGKLLAPPFDVMDLGRMAMCSDPNAATFAIWQAKRHPGVGVTGEPGSFGWCQLNVPATGREKAKPFYAAALGWTFRDDPMPMGDFYTTWLGGGVPRGGMMGMPPGITHPAHWLLYLASADVDATTGKSKELGGQTIVPPMDIPGIGRFAVLQDPQGATFAIVKFKTPMGGGAPS